MAEKRHPGYEQTALDGLLQSIEVISQKQIKVVVNGGALNSKVLAEVVHREASPFFPFSFAHSYGMQAKKKNLSLDIAWVEGDNLMGRCKELLRPDRALTHLDSDNKAVVVDKTLCVLRSLRSSL
jgi:hypothetical protein